MRVAVVDIGSNSTRLLVADVGADGAVAEVDRASVVTRLAAGLEAGGSLGADARARVLAVVGDYGARIRAARAERALAVLTSAVRDAANGREFASAAGADAGIAARILSGDEEAALTFAGAAHGAGVVVIDIGGGSTELVTADFHVSTQVGVVRHGERHLRSDPPAPAELEALAADAGATLRAALPEHVRATITRGVAVAGTPTSCAAIELALDPYDSAAVEGHVLDRATLIAQRDMLAALTPEERRRVPGLHPDRASVIVPGVVILLAALAATGLDRVRTSERDLLHGAARALAFGQLPQTGDARAPNLDVRTMAAS